MTNREFLEAGELCIHCGACCMAITGAPVNIAEDVPRMMSGLNLSFEEVVNGITWQDVGSDTIHIRAQEDSTNCAALRIENGRHTCEIYPHRLRICRTFACAVLTDARIYIETDSAPIGNMFHSVAAGDFQRTALGFVPVTRSQFRWDCELDYNSTLPNNELREEAIMFRKGTLPFFQGLVQIQIPEFPPHR